MKEIASLEKKEVKINKTTNYTEEFDSFLLWLMISLLAYQLIEVINFVRR
jgi:hypothetical protein